MAWRNLVELHGMENRHPEWPIPKPKPVGVILAFSKYKSKRGADHWITKPDYDNLAKAVTDALNGIAWKDDCQIIRAIELKDYRTEAGCVIKILWGQELVDLCRSLTELLRSFQ